MKSPYEGLPAKAFWRSGVAERSALDPGDLYVPKFPISRKMRVVTAGSCFAQHVGRALRTAGFNVIDTEPVPASLSDKVANEFGYRLYSARYGNIYTARQLIQLLDEVEGKVKPADPVWERGGRYFDALRPGVEPEGLPSPEDVAAHRAQHLKAVDEAFAQADLFVFTLGLTEAWMHTASETVYPTAPGTIAGTFDPAIHSFVNYSFPGVLRDLQAFRARMMARNPSIRFLVTVSPVPLTATASGQHVEVATAYSKAVLRAVAGTMAERFANVDYFPSYEIITSQNNRGVYFETNRRSVTAQGVATAMSLFLKAHGADSGPQARPADREDDDEGPSRPAPRAKGKGRRAAREAEDVVCEEALLDAFGR